MRKLKVLVTTVGGMTSPDILKALKYQDEFEITLYGTDAFQYAVGRKFVDEFYVSPNSGEDELKFVEFIDEVARRQNIDVIIPCGNEDNLALAKFRTKLNTKIMVGDYDDLICAYDKGKVYDSLKAKFPAYAPKYFIVNKYEDFIAAVGSLGFPEYKVAVKPRFGRGGRGVYILSNDFDSDRIFKSKPMNEYPFDFFSNLLKTKDEFEDLIVMEYLSDPYYSLYSLSENGHNLFTVNHIREWGNASQTFRGKVYYDENLERVASGIIETFNLTYTNNMELATSTDNRIVLFDLNPRIGASSGIDKEIGFNFPLSSMKLALGEDVKVDKEAFIKPKTFLRFFDQVWL